MISIYFTGIENRYNREKYAKLLLDANADPNLYDTYGLTPLMHASINGQYDYVALLLSYTNTNYEICDKAGNNALMLAARYGQVEVLQEFKDHIMYHKSISLKLLDNQNYNNKSALDLAYEGNHYECASLLTTLKAASTADQGLLEPEKQVNNIIESSFQFKRTAVPNNSLRTGLNSFEQSSHPDSHQKTYRNNDRNIKNVKLPPINGKRLVEYSEWTQNRKVRNDRNTI